LKATRNSPGNDLDKLSRIKALSWLSSSETRLLATRLVIADFKQSEVMFDQLTSVSEAHILLKGMARITCQNAHGQRIPIAIIAPGLIAELPSAPLSRFDFRCEAYNDCKVGHLSRFDFDEITMNGYKLASTKMSENNLRQWSRLILRTSGFLKLDLHDRVALTLLELCSDFGIEESRGMLLRAPFTHQDIADLVGASRPRVTEHLAQMELEHLVTRQGRQLIVDVNKMVTTFGFPTQEGGSTANPSRKYLQATPRGSG
jgi:CRP-like cAMP-binding protein